MMGLRTLHIDDRLDWGGGQQQAVYLCKGLREREVEAVLCCRSGSEIEKRAVSLDIPTVNLPLCGEFDLVSAVLLAGLLRKGGYRICHAHTSHAHTIACLAATMAWRCGVVVSRRVAFRRGSNPLSRIKYRFGVDLYIAISETVQTVLVEDGVAPGKITIVHSGISTERADSAKAADLTEKLKIPRDSFVIGNIGSLVDAKGQIFLVRAMPHILKGVPNAFFVIVGEGKERMALEAEARRLSVDNRLILTGFREDALSLLKSFDIYAVPSRMEGLNTSLLDAMAACRPVVASAAGGIRDVLVDGKNGILVPVGDVEALADGIVRLALDPGLAEDLARNARQTVLDKFTDDRMVEETLEAYKLVGLTLRKATP